MTGDSIWHAARVGLMAGELPQAKTTSYGDIARAMEAIYVRAIPLADDETFDKAMTSSRAVPARRRSRSRSRSMLAALVISIW